METQQAAEVLLEADEQLDKLHYESFLSLKALQPKADKITSEVRGEMEGVILNALRVQEDRAEAISEAITEFEMVLEAQTPFAYTYMIEQLRGFMMPILVDGADQNFSDKTTKVINEEIKKDIREAGRCLAFELPTAAGIHMMRAFEKVLRHFYKVSTGKEPGTTDIYKLIRDLREHHPDTDPKILNILDQIRDLHRNPLAHDVFLEIDEAVEIFDIAKSAITAMARKL